MKIVGFIAAAILIFFGVLFIMGAFSANGTIGWIFIGIILVSIGLAIIFLVTRKKSGAGDSQNVTYNIDLPGEVNLDTLKCESCGGALTKKDINMVAGAPVVTCPYCHTTYQITEEPKW
jgi:hypothetical protein